MKKIFLKAYFRNNIGDDLFVRHMAHRYPQILFQVFAHPKYQIPFKDINNIRFVPAYFYYINKICNKIFNRPIVYNVFFDTAHTVVHIGGSVFIEQKDVDYYKKHMHVSKKQFNIGCNFGPCKTQAYYDYVYKGLEKIKDICFRDMYSYNKFRSLSNVRVAPDVLFGYKEYPAYKQGDGIGISVINLDKREGLREKAEAYYKVIAEFIDLCVQKRIKVKLFGFCIDEGDKKAIEKIIEYTKSKKVCVYNYNGDTQSFLREFNSCEFIMASRFHAMIIGWALKKKVFPIIYSNKQTNVIDDIRYSGKVWDLQTNQKYSAEELLENCTQSITLDDIDKYVKEAEQQFSALDLHIREVKL